MSKNKKIVLIVILIILALAIIGALVYFIGFGTKTESDILDGSTSKVNKLYSELKGKQEFSFKTTLDDQNNSYYAKKDEKACINTIYEGRETNYIIRDGNTYLIVDDQKTYYTYQNNEVDLDKIIVQLGNLKDKQYIEGKEKIENKEYKYEEFEGVTKFLLKNADESEEKTAKTRFYFSGDKLVYIKTIIGNEQEILKVDISYDIDDKLFEIPSNYKSA